MKLMSYNIRIIYKSCRSADIDLADFISRLDELVKPCNANCTVFLDIKKDGYLDEKSSRCFLSLDSKALSTLIFIPVFQYRVLNRSSKLIHPLKFFC